MCLLVAMPTSLCVNSEIVYSPLVFTLVSEGLDVEALIETLSQLTTVNDTEAVKDELSKLVATLRTRTLEASTKELEKVRSPQSMHEMHWDYCSPL